MQVMMARPVPPELALEQAQAPELAQLAQPAQPWSVALQLTAVSSQMIGDVLYEYLVLDVVALVQQYAKQGHVMVLSARDRAGTDAHNAPACVVYDPSRDQWHSQLVDALKDTCVLTGALLGDGALHLCGGEQHLRLSLVTGQCASHPTLQEVRPGDQAMVLHDSLFVVSLSYVDRTIIHSFDPATHRWHFKSRKPPLNKSLSRAVACGGYIYIVGGIPETNIERYDPLQDVWIGCAPLLGERWSGTAAASDNAIYICGGRRGSRHLAPSNRCLKSCEQYDPGTDRWHLIAPMKQPLAISTSAYIDGHILMCGGMACGRRDDQTLPEHAGCQCEWQPVTDVASYDCRKNEWRSVSPMPMSLIPPLPGSISGRGRSIAVVV
jgi:hypothetical protein